MGERRQYPRGSARQIIDYNNVIANLGKESVICIDNGILSICRYFLGSRGLWRTTYSLSSDDTYYIIPDDTEFNPIKHTISEFLERTSTMGTCDDLITALQQINTTLAQMAVNNQCGCAYGSQGSGVYEQPETGFVVDDDNYPVGFDDRSVYDDYRCSVANYIVDLIKVDLVWFQNLDVTAVSAAVLATALVTPIPFVQLTGLALVVTEAIIEATLDTMLEAVIDAIDNNRDELVCVIYNAIDEADAKLGVTEFFESKVDALGESFIGYFINNDVFRYLYEKVALVLEGYDCSGCEPVPILAVNEAFMPNTDWTQELVGATLNFTSNSQFEAGKYIIHVITDVARECVDVTLAGVTQVTPDYDASFADAGGGHDYNGYAQFEVDIEASDTLLGLYIKSATPFTGSVTVVP